MQTTQTRGLTVGTRRTGTAHDGYTYTGVLRHNGRAVVECGHQHTNRDMSSGANGRSAADCARDVLAGARNAHTAASNTAGFRDRWLKLTRGGFVTPESVIDAARASAAQAADAYEAAVAATRAHLDQYPDMPTPVVAPDEPPVIGDLPEWMLGFGS